MMSVLKRAKKLIPLSIKTRCAYVLSRPDLQQYEHLRGHRKVIIALAADYPNLGDVAITYAHTLFVKACLPEYEIVDFPCAATYLQLKALKLVCTPDDIITITGGGNMCDRYPSIEDARRFLVGSFPDNRIISFPQTIDFSDTTAGRRELKKSRRAYGRHGGLQLFAREPVSLETMRREFPGTTVRLVPDIVLSLSGFARYGIRRGVLLCVRNDRESAMGAATRKKLIEQIATEVPEARITDTVLPLDRRLTVEEREHQLQWLLSDFGEADAVVTDRLHGMIIAAITGTPCVVMQNNNHKIAATYRAWLADLPHVRLVEGFESETVLMALREVRRLGEGVAQPTPQLADEFLPLREAIMGAAQ